jgi:hypothetical protein
MNTKEPAASSPPADPGPSSCFSMGPLPPWPSSPIRGEGGLALCSLGPDMVTRLPYHPPRGSPSLPPPPSSPQGPESQPVVRRSRAPKAHQRGLRPKPAPLTGLYKAHRRVIACNYPSAPLTYVPESPQDLLPWNPTYPTMGTGRNRYPLPPIAPFRTCIYTNHHQLV